MMTASGTPAGGGGGGGGGATPSLPSAGQLSWAQVAQAAYAAGFRGSELQTVVALTGVESGRNPRAHNAVPPDNSYGLWQINMIGNLGPSRKKSLGLSTYEQLYDPNVNARAAWDISGHGSSFRPWTSYTSGNYRQYMDDALQGIHQAHLGDIPERGLEYAAMMPMMQTVGDSAQMVFHNTFQINSGGGSGGGGTAIDMRRAASQIADHLEDEMRRRQARNN